MTDIDDSNPIRTAYEAGKERAEVGPRITWIRHPTDGQTEIPVRLERSTEGEETVRLADDVLAALDKRTDGPLRRAGRFTLTELDSFIGYVNRYRSGDRAGPEASVLAGESVVYADTKAFTVTCVFDDHPPGEMVGDAAWREHRAVYTCPRSAEWMAWSERDGRAMAQTVFAEFLEERLADLAAGKKQTGEDYPRPLDMLQLARQLHIKLKGEIGKQFDPTTGTYSMVNKLDHGEGSTPIPSSFLLRIPVFEGGALYEIEARVRFSINEGAPTFGYQLHRRPEIERDAFGAVREAVIKGTGLPLFAGTP